MRIMQVKLYQFNELTEEAKQEAINNLRDINTDYNWWESVYEDANDIGLKLTGFDLDRNKHATGELTDGMEYTIQQIKDNHGESCETYKLACQYDLDRSDLVAKYSEENNPHKVAEANNDIFDDEMDDLEAEFLKELLEEYASMLQKEYEYKISDESVIETIEANEYEFNEHGKLA